jgi:hypothetical protein
MNAIAIIISLIALVGAGFAFLRASSSHRIMTKRVEKQKDRIDILEERLRKLEGNAPRGRRSTEETQEEGRRNPARQERHEQQEQRHEERQKQRSKKNKPERQPQDRTQQDEQPQERQQERQQQERQQERRQREKKSPDMPQQLQERAPEDRSASERQTQQQEEGQQRRPRRDNRRRNEPRDSGHSLEGEQERGISNTPVNLEIASASLLDELEQEAASANSIPVATSAPVTADAPTPAESPAHPGKAYAIIPEDGLIRQHQLQQQPDSDSYIEVDVPKEGGNQTYYRFNLAGNHAFVISQGIDRLENAFSFEKPSNRMVSQVVQQHDGVLARVGNGWKIEQKARIDFR